MEFAFFDGDNIGATIEAFLLEGAIEEATSLSSNINHALDEIKRILENSEEYEILIFGGDDLMFLSKNKEIPPDLVERIRNTFKVITGCTMSGGIGKTVQEAMECLDRAKNTGKNKTIRK